MYYHQNSSNINATLLVSPRKTSRYLLFNDDNLLRGWVNKGPSYGNQRADSGIKKGNIGNTPIADTVTYLYVLAAQEDNIVLFIRHNTWQNTSIKNSV